MVWLGIILASITMAGIWTFDTMNQSLLHDVKNVSGVTIDNLQVSVW